MSGFIDFDLVKDINKAHEAGVFEEMGDESENEERHVSELKRRMAALDEKETFVTLQALIKHHRKTVIKTFEFMEKEGGKA